MVLSSEVATMLLALHCLRSIIAGTPPHRTLKHGRRIRFIPPEGGYSIRNLGAGQVCLVGRRVPVARCPNLLVQPMHLAYWGRC